MRHWDIKLVVIASLGVAAFCLVVLLRNFGLNNVPDENVVYIDPAVGGIESGEWEAREIGGSEFAQDLDAIGLEERDSVEE